jgi:hypothetical protein
MSSNKLRTILNLSREIFLSCTHIYALDSQSQYEFQTQALHSDALSDPLPFALMPLNFGSTLHPLMPLKAK